MSRDWTLGIRFSPEEKAQLERAARLQDRELFDWARRALLRVAKRQIAGKRRRRKEKGYEAEGDPRQRVYS